LITTIIPTYRRPKLLRRAIKSVLNQTYPHFQVCVYDNASGDETAAVVAELAKKDSRVKYYCHSENIGAFNNFQCGLTQVDTPYFSFLSDDDLLLPDFYQDALVGFEQYPEALFSSTKIIRMDDKGNCWEAGAGLKWVPGLYRPPHGLFAMLKYGHITWTGILFREEVRQLVGLLDSETGRFSDRDFELRIAARYPFVVSLRPGAVFFSRSSTFSSSIIMRFDYIWPYVHKMSCNLTNNERITLETLELIKPMLINYESKQLFRVGVASVRFKNFGDGYKIAQLLRDRYHLFTRAFCLYGVAKVCQHLPFIHSLVVVLYDFQRHIRQDKRHSVKTEGEFDVKILN